jgi:hypothetical protein
MPLSSPVVSTTYSIDQEASTLGLPPLQVPDLALWPTLSTSDQTALVDWLASYQATIDALQGPLATIKDPATASSEALAQAIVAKMTNHRFCRQRPTDRVGMTEAVQFAIDHHQPIACVLGHGPLKNLNNCGASLAAQQPDWGEWFAYVQLCRLALAVQALYPPGIRISLYLDDARASFANGIAQATMNTYRHRLEAFIVQHGFSPLIYSITPFSTLYSVYQVDSFMDQAEANFHAWLAQPTNQPAWQTTVLHACRNHWCDPDMPEAEHHALAEQAAKRYWIGHQAEVLSGLWSPPHTVVMRYSPHPRAYQIFTLRKGSVTQPWQGVGTITQTAPGKFEPVVLTRQKQPHALKG